MDILDHSPLEKLLITITGYLEEVYNFILPVYPKEAIEGLTGYMELPKSEKIKYPQNKKTLDEDQILDNAIRAFSMYRLLYAKVETIVKMSKSRITVNEMAKICMDIESANLYYRLATILKMEKQVEKEIKAAIEEEIDKIKTKISKRNKDNINSRWEKEREKPLNNAIREMRKCALAIMEEEIISKAHKDWQHHDFVRWVLRQEDSEGNLLFPPPEDDDDGKKIKAGLEKKDLLGSLAGMINGKGLDCPISGKKKN